MKQKITNWLSAFRLRTLPLAFSSIVTGSAIAYYHHSFDTIIFTLALLTTLFLQVLSNLANDYGDSNHGVDNKDRIGPTRAMQSGAISKSSMKKAIIVFSILSFSSGIPLIVEGTKHISLKWFLIFLGLGIASIVAAIKYTAGKNPYGYKGFGDVFVFLFFGIVGVLGTFILHFQHINRFVLLDALYPAISMGCFSAAVLNLNNMRDHVNDQKSGKITLAVRLGITGSKIYHGTLLIAGVTAMYLFGSTLYFSLKDYLILGIPTLIFATHLVKTFRNNSPKDLDPELKKVALTTFASALILLFIIVSTT